MPGSREEDFKKNNAFSLYDLYGHALAQEPLPGGHEIYNFGRPFHGHHYYILGLSDLCLEVEEKIFKIMHSLYDLYGHALAQEPLPRGHEINNFGRPFLGHHYYILGLSDVCLVLKKLIVTEMIKRDNT